MNPIVPLFLVLGAGSPVISGTALARGPSGLERALEHFSARWSVRFQRVAPRTSDDSAGARQSDTSEHVEALLDAARVALGALDVRETSEALDRADRLLQSHPELAQAAWLRAEVLALGAELAEKTGREGAQTLRMRAAVLEGPRSAPFGAASAPDAAWPAPLGIELAGVTARDVVEWDSVVVSAPFQTLPGEHAVRVLRAGRVHWAGWVTITPATSTLSLPMRPLAPCSADDLEGTVDGPDGPVPPADVRCAQWAAARIRAGGVAELALCHGARCGAWHAPRVEPAPFRGPAQPAVAEGFPSWASFTLAGAGAVALTSVLLFAAGAFDGGRDEDRWEYGGLQPAR